VEHVAIDLGAKRSQICVRSADGRIVEEKRWPTISYYKTLLGRLDVRTGKITGATFRSDEC
jgi:hypothetical protein